MNIKLTVLIIFVLILVGCKDKSKDKNVDLAYVKEIQQWHEQRIENLKKDNGWLNLVGLFWLKEGENKFGSDLSNDIVFPDNAPKFIGSFILEKGLVKIKLSKNLEVFVDSQRVTEKILKHDLEGKPTIISYKSLRWNVIKRQNKYGIRLRDLETPLVKNFQKIDTYPIDKTWKIEARFVPYTSPKPIQIPTVIGTIEEDTARGYLAFQIEGEEFRLDPTSEGEKLFVIFADETNGKETYGAGRFLYVDKPDSTGKTYIDFNKAYNPPCAFTKYATCPLPPKQNRLKVEITAGEKKFEGGH